MAVDGDSYGTIAGVQLLIGDIVDSRTFSVSTVPTLVEAEKAIDDVADELNSLLDVYGYTAPVVLADFPFAYGMLRSCNEAGAAARLLGSVPPNVYDPDEEILDAGNSRQQTYQNILNKCFKRIRDQELRADRRQGKLGNVFAGSQEDASGNKKVPLITRDLDSNPLTSRQFVE